MNQSLKNKNVILGVSGGIAAYKSCEIVRDLVKAKANVNVILTKAGAQFITPLTLQTLSKNPIHLDMFNLIEEKDIRHISLADMADLILIAPATADIIAKVNAGICDELLLSVISASRSPVVFAPSMNVNMWENSITKRNIASLKELGYTFVDPDKGELACGYEGVGRLAKKEIIFNTIIKVLEKND